jgi:hypothetical protein
MRQKIQNLKQKLTEGIMPDSQFSAFKLTLLTEEYNGAKEGTFKDVLREILADQSLSQIARIRCPYSQHNSDKPA